MYPELSPSSIIIWTGAALLLHAFFCTLVKTCIHSLTLTEITRFHTYHPHTAARLDYFRKNRIIPAVTIDVFRYGGLLAGYSIVRPLLHDIPPTMWWVGTGSFTFLYILIGRVLPQATGNRFKVSLAFIVVHPLTLLCLLLTPVTILFTIIGKAIAVPQTPTIEQIRSDIKQLARTAATEKAISAQQAHLITRSIELSEITAADIMVKRNDIRAISDTVSLNDALIDAHLHHHTRFPLIHSHDIDQIIGYVNFKDIVGALRANPSDPSLVGIKRPLETVKASEPLPELLQKLTRGYQHIVIVTDEMRATLGMVTLEDLMETLLGDLEDEYDTPPSFIIQLGDNRFCAGGGTHFSDLREKVSSRFPDWDLTISEWMSGVAKGDVPDQFSTTYQQCTFTVRKVARGNVFDVLVDRHTSNIA